MMNNYPVDFGSLGRLIQETVKGRDGQIGGATIRVVKRDRQHELLHRPIQLLYLLEVHYPRSAEAGTEGTEELSENSSPLEVEDKSA